MTLPTAGSSTPTGYLQMGLLGQICLHIVRNNPVNTTDPTGNFAITATVALITFGVALVATALAVGISSSPGFQGAVEGLCESVGSVAEQIKEKLTNSFSKIKKPQTPVCIAGCIPIYIMKW